jgi:2-polyprenyl-6-methoxyphenol hydroxylase-like FAD-dependent oxidoreductase
MDGTPSRGFTGVGGFLPISSLPENLREGVMKDPLTFTAGPNSYFAYFPASGFSPEPSPKNQISWWSVYESTPPPSRDILLTDLRAQLLERHDSWKSPYDTSKSRIFPSIISLACGPEHGNSELAVEKGILILPQFVTKPLPRWCSSSGKIILLGDAAHPVPPESGQGVSCAVEDGLALALFLKHYLGQRPTSTTKEVDQAEALKQTAAAYEAVRMGRIAMILNIGKFQSGTLIAKTWWQRWIWDWMMWILCELNHFMFFCRVL